MSRRIDRQELLQHFSLHPSVKTLVSACASTSKKVVHAKGIIGSEMALVISNVTSQNSSPQVIIAHDREEAAYLAFDFEQLMPAVDVVLFPTSYKRPYQFEEIDNANILQRTEVLNRINQSSNKKLVILTYPDALTEKVINKKSLVKNTFTISVGEKLDMNFITELLHEYGFEKVDFVYEAGNFSTRGGIIDIFSYSNELPYRVELVGDEIESIRVFNPETQLSVEKNNSLTIVPDIQTKLLQESRENFFDYIGSSVVWIRNYKEAIANIDKSFAKIQHTFKDIISATSTTLLQDPKEIFETGETFDKALLKNDIIECGNQFLKEASQVVLFDSKPQPSFNKDFKQIAELLGEYVSRGYKTIICGDPKNLDMLEAVLLQHDPSLELYIWTHSLHEGFICDDEKIVVFSDHQLLDRFHRYKSKERYSRSKSITLKELYELQPGDYVTHIDYGIGRFAGLERKHVDGKDQELIRIVYKDDDVLYINVHSIHKVARYSGRDGAPPIMSKLGSGDWDTKKSKVKKKVKEIAINLIELYAKRRASPGFQFSKDGYMQVELETSFLYEDTIDQGRATEDVKRDMEQSWPMDRLVCGDVGFGKTEVAIRAAFKAACDGKQVAVLVPTTILALQHYKTFRDRLSKFPCKVDYINRFRSSSDVKKVAEDLKEGKIDILIGTHSLVGKEIKFKNLGLLIIDEEQKFGVAVKEKIKEITHNVDVLTLTATPIPRTLQFSLMGARDLSIIATPPSNRQPVTTEIHAFSDVIIRDAVSHELSRNGQVFIVHNRIADIEGIANTVLRMVPDAKVAIAHGQMDGKKLEDVMLRFVNHEYDVLVSTNIIESGLDIPNANTILINQAHMYGLSDLHQMRGRVGRSNRKAFCYLLTLPMATLTSDARKRLSTLEEFSDLGDGYKIAMRDLDIRGAGNLLGGEQSGFINDIGFETYQKVLDEAIQELKETVFKDLFEQATAVPVIKKTDCAIETDLSMLIPETYVSNISERLRLYNDLDNIKDELALQHFYTSLIDRFGPLPNEVEDLVKTVRVRWQAEQLGFEKLIIKGGSMKCYASTINNEAYFQSPIFERILSCVQKNPRRCQMKDVKQKMLFAVDKIDSIESAQDFLADINANSIS